MEKSNIYQIRVKARIYAGEKFLYPVEFPIQIEAPDEETGRVMAAETPRSLRVEGAVTLGRHGYAEANIPLEKIGLHFPIRENPEFRFLGHRFERNTVTEVNVYKESQTICIRFNQKNGKKDSATFGGGPISDADWEERVKELFTSLGVIR